MEFTEKFLVVDFTNDEIAHKSHKVLQNPLAQKYYELKQQCLSENRLFEDPEFSTRNHPLFKHQISPCSAIQWLRPSEFISEPKFVVDGVSDVDVQPGCIPNGWLLTAMVNLTTNKKAFYRVVPHDNCFDADQYAGIFHFRFWQYGHWIDVVIDDRLPTLVGKLIFIRSSQQNELWSALLEKAYAKLRGSYKALSYGTVGEAMQDFTGGVLESFRFTEKKPPSDDLFDLINCSLKKGYMVAAIKFSNCPDTKDQKNYTYAITKTISLGYTQQNSICLKDLWKECSKTEFCNEHWLQFDEFVQSYDGVEICQLSPIPLSDSGKVVLQWHESFIDGTWVVGSTAGGCRDHVGSFWMNPQHVISLLQPDSVRYDSGMCSLAISLVQKHPRNMIKTLTIGFVLYRITETILRTKPKPMIFSRRNEPEIVHTTYSSSREVSCRLEVTPGIYLLIPTTKHPNESGEFFLRIYTQLRSVQNCTDGFELIDRLAAIDGWEPMVRMFYNLASDKGTINYASLTNILIEHFFEPKAKHKHQTKVIDREFIERISQSLIAWVNGKHSTRLKFGQFKQVMRDVLNWQAVFNLYDVDRSGSLDRKQLQKALKDTTFQKNDQVLHNSLTQLCNLKNKLELEEFVFYAVESKGPCALVRERKGVVVPVWSWYTASMRG